MANFKTLLQERNAYVLYHECNRFIELCFANIVLQLNEQGYDNFKDYIEELAARFRGSETPNQRYIRIVTPFCGIFFLLSPNELEGLWEILKKASLKLQIARNLKDHLN